jgi:hypothetical protein
MMAARRSKSTMIIGNLGSHPTIETSINPTIQSIYPTSDTSCQVLVARDGAWIGNCNLQLGITSNFKPFSVYYSLH